MDRYDGYPVIAFAYPYGAHTAAIDDAVLHDFQARANDRRRVVPEVMVLGATRFRIYRSEALPTVRLGPRVRDSLAVIVRGRMQGCARPRSVSDPIGFESGWMELAAL